MSTAGGGAAAVIVDIMANASQLGTSLQQAEKQVQQSADRMGKAMDSAGIGGGMAAGGAQGFGGRISQMMRGNTAIVQNAALAFGQSMASDINRGVERRFDLGGSMSSGFESAIKAIPHWSAQFGAMLGDSLKPYGTDIGRMLSESIFGELGLSREAEFEEGTFYGLFDYIDDLVNDRTQRSFGRVRKIANQNLILGRQDELAALQAEQQILNMTDQRGRMFQSRMHMGLAEVQTSMGTFRTGFGTPEEASARVYDAAIKQLVSLERIESIVKEIGHYARTAMRN